MPGPPHSQGYQHSLQAGQTYDRTKSTTDTNGHPAYPTSITTGHPVHSSQEYPVHGVPENDFRGDYQVTHRPRDNHALMMDQGIKSTTEFDETSEPVKYVQI
jgi:hypothetical protein